ncbi:MAG: hypothetical protein E6H09_15730 [Bacteroidetes bacterium]|nr:MAG: hypothetical protein E6H09_15730 [Bacteroidota bacterium]
MRWMKWIGLAAAITLVIACFMIWITLPSKNITVTGIDAGGTNVGKPGYFHFICTLRVWAKRANLFVAPINFAWAVCNFFIVTGCRAGECPEKHVAVYLILIASALMLGSALFADLPTKRINRQSI